MKWCIQKEVDGVITDDPKRYLEVCESYYGGEDVGHSWGEWRSVIWWNWMAAVFGLGFRFRHGFWVDVDGVRKRL